MQKILLRDGEIKLDYNKVSVKVSFVKMCFVKMCFDSILLTVNMANIV